MDIFEKALFPKDPFSDLDLCYRHSDEEATMTVLAVSSRDLSGSLRLRVQSWSRTRLRIVAPIARIFVARNCFLSL